MLKHGNSWGMIFYSRINCCRISSIDCVSQVFRARTSADAVDYISKLLVRIPQSHQIKISSLKFHISKGEEIHSVQVGLGK